MEVKRFLFLLTMLIIHFLSVKTSTCFSKIGGGSHTCILASTHQTKCWGSNYYGELGSGDDDRIGLVPGEMGDNLSFVDVNQSVISIQAGNYVTCAHLSDFTAKCWGRNYEGQLGIGNTTHKGDDPGEMGSYLPPINFGSGVLVQKLAASFLYHSFMISNEGLIKGWGYNNYGALGLEDYEHRGNNPQEMGDYLPYVDLGTGMIAQDVKLGYQSSCAFLVNLDVKCWGGNSYGALGQGDDDDRGGNIDDMGDNLSPIKFPDGVVIDRMRTGSSNAGILAEDGRIFLWGSNVDGQLGIPSVGNQYNIGDGSCEMGNYLNPVNVGSGLVTIDLSMGTVYECLILDNFQLKCFGLSNQGQLGYGDTSDRGSSENQMGDYLPFVNLGSGVTAVSVHLGSLHTCVVLNDDSLKCFGYNNNGQLGIGNQENQGDEPNEMGDYLQPLDLGTGVEIQICYDYSPTMFPSITFSPTFDPTVDPSFQPTITFNPTNDPTFEPTLFPSVSFSPSIVNLNCQSSRFAGSYSTFSLSNSRQIKGWGYNNNGQLGYGDPVSRGSSQGDMGDYLPFIDLPKNVISVHSGLYHTCAHLSTLEVACWGDNSYGVLGIGVSYSWSDIGDDPNEMGSNLESSDFGSNLMIAQIEVGFYVTMIRTADNQIKGFGRNYEGQLGYGTSGAYGGSFNDLGDYLPFTDVGTESISSFSYGLSFGCVLSASDSMKCWGRNDYGQLGLGHSSHIGDEPNEMGDNLTAVELPTGVQVQKMVSDSTINGIITSDGDLFMWGYNSDGQLGVGSDNSVGDGECEMGDFLVSTQVGFGFEVLDLQGGFYHTCALLDNFQIKCWGYNDYGQLGYGDSEARGDEDGEMSDYLPFVNLGEGQAVRELQIGGFHSCVILIDNSMRCWGYNGDGRLGLGTTSNFGDNPGEMGDNLSAIDLGTDFGDEVSICFEAFYTFTPTFFPVQLSKDGDDDNNQVGAIVGGVVGGVVSAGLAALWYRKQRSPDYVKQKLEDEKKFKENEKLRKETELKSKTKETV